MVRRDKSACHDVTSGRLVLIYVLRKAGRGGVKPFYASWQVCSLLAVCRWGLL